MEQHKEILENLVSGTVLKTNGITQQLDQFKRTDLARQQKEVVGSICTLNNSPRDTASTAQTHSPRTLIISHDRGMRHAAMRLRSKGSDARKGE